MATEAQNVVEKDGAKPMVKYSVFKPQLQVQAPNAAAAVEFYKAAFGAEEVSRHILPEMNSDQDTPPLLSVDLKLGGSVFAVSDLPVDAPVKIEGDSIVFCLVTGGELDAVIAKAVGAGAVVKGYVKEDEVNGRVGKVVDPHGYEWVICGPLGPLPDYCPYPSPKSPFSPPPSPSTAILRDYIRLDKELIEACCEWEKAVDAYEEEDDGGDLITMLDLKRMVDNTRAEFEEATDNFEDLKERLNDFDVYTITSFQEFEVLEDRSLLGKRLWIHHKTPVKDIVAIHRRTNAYGKKHGLEPGIRVILEEMLSDEERERAKAGEKLDLFSEKFPEWLSSDEEIHDTIGEG